MNNISSAIEWQGVKHHLEQEIRHFDYKIRKDLYIMLKNADILITELSKLEIECRRQQKPTRKFLEHLEKTNTMISDINKMITMGALL
jgi:hypothetical protein